MAGKLGEFKKNNSNIFEKMVKETHLFPKFANEKRFAHRGPVMEI